MRTPQQLTVTLDAIGGIATRLDLLTHDPRTDLVSRVLHTRRQWEPFETRLWLASQRKNDTVVDVGANLGYFSLLSALATQRARRVVAFEPAADNFALLRANLARNRCDHRVEAVNAALGMSDTSTLLYRSDDNFGDHQVYVGDGPRQTETVELREGAGSLRDMGVGRIDLLKVDTQGSEYDVLAGLMPLVECSVPGLRLLLELTPWSLRRAASSGASLLALLEPLSLPVAIVDHVNHALVPSTYPALTRWCDNVDSTDGDRGFMNIYLGTPPPGF